ncbi:hypothetical protein PLICRDRAFT_175414 [Plicaturopsis crispa FD-325 SS-3]|nr:hypothetical protein PLICRDRAFT_175414 [Plicaturopsis crispa FD-325 SS-3]
MQRLHLSVGDRIPTLDELYDVTSHYIQHLIASFDRKGHVNRAHAAILNLRNSVSSYTFNTIDYILVYAALSMFLLLCVFSSRRPTKKPDLAEIRMALHALLTVISPTRSIWPSSYPAIAKKSVHERSGTLMLPLIDLANDIISGSIEFRNIQHDLPALIHGDIDADGWSVRIHTRWSCCIKILSCVVNLQLSAPPYKSLKSSDMLPPSYTLENSTARFAPDYSSPSVPLLSEVLYLDSLPSSHIKPAIRELQVTLARGESAMVIFTTLSHRISFFSADFILAAFPFTLRAHGQEPRHTTAPLFSSLHHTIELLSSGPSPFTIRSVQSASEEHIAASRARLRDIEVRLSSPDAASNGLEGLREELLFTAWETSLYKTGYLARWVVVVSR